MWSSPIHVVYSEVFFSQIFSPEVLIIIKFKKILLCSCWCEYGWKSNVILKLEVCFCLFCIEDYVNRIDHIIFLKMSQEARDSGIVVDNSLSDNDSLSSVTSSNRGMSYVQRLRKRFEILAKEQELEFHSG